MKAVPRRLSSAWRFNARFMRATPAFRNGVAESRFDANGDLAYL
jgi:hypothetical protein